MLTCHTPHRALEWQSTKTRWYSRRKTRSMVRVATGLRTQIRTQIMVHTTDLQRRPVAIPATILQI